MNKVERITKLSGFENYVKLTSRVTHQGNPTTILMCGSLEELNVCINAYAMDGEGAIGSKTTPRITVGIDTYKKLSGDNTATYELAFLGTPEKLEFGEDTFYRAHMSIIIKSEVKTDAEIESILDKKTGRDKLKKQEQLEVAVGKFAWDVPEFIGGLFITAAVSIGILVILTILVAVFKWSIIFLTVGA